MSLLLFTATAAAIAKMTYLSNYGKYGDLLFDSADITIWTTIEITVAMIAGSIPCLKPLFKKILDLSSVYRGGGGGKSSHQRYYYGQNSGHHFGNNGRSRSSTFGAHRRRTLKAEESGKFEMFGSVVDGSCRAGGFAHDNNTSSSCTCKGGKSNHDASTVALDNNSEEFILQGLVPEAPVGITKTVQVTVENRSNYGKGNDMA
ncbi:hypothetical protein PG994_003547 [Apiospora phragmitis]|uniref:Rhodopsin domain-containing protein n=1 Tax=Apiospora phragmitis TaxID=2905665 RepID=A0ABR1VYD5_9PEZI